MTTRLYKYLTETKGLDGEQARTIISQAAHESDFWRSPVFKNSNNMFGIKTHNRTVEGKRQSAYNGYTTYKDIEGSLNDIIDLLRLRYSLKAAYDVFAYALILKERGYYEAPLKEYVGGMLNAYKALFPDEYKKRYE